MSEPIIIEFTVTCDPVHAFHTWTTMIDRWWPSDHTVSGDPDTRAVLEPRLGGRVFERTSDGTEHEWGQVVAWDPPQSFSYTWHLGTDPADTTRVTVSFTDRHGETTVRIEHCGWEHLGGDADRRRTRNVAGWDGLLPHFVTAVEHPDRTGRP